MRARVDVCVGGCRSPFLAVPACQPTPPSAPPPPPPTQKKVIHPIAESLDIPRARVYANLLQFDAATGEYAGFDAAEFTSRSGGKAAAIREIKVLLCFVFCVLSCAVMCVLRCVA